MIQLPNGCKCSPLKVTPKNWEKAPATSMKRKWLIYYRFHDPNFTKDYPKGKLVIIKGMNSVSIHETRVQITQDLIAAELYNLKELHYNPITNFIHETKPSEHSGLEKFHIDKDMPFIEALNKAKALGNFSKSVNKDIKSVLKYFTPAAEKLQLHDIPVCEVKKRHLVAIMAQCGQDKAATWTNRTFNFYKAHISMLLTYLEDECIIDDNPMLRVKPMEHQPAKREILNDKERAIIDEALRKDNIDFWLFMQIFFHSGARTTELLSVKDSDVDLDNRLVTYTVKKGGKARVVKRDIKDVALLYWWVAIRRCKPGQYVFSKNLKPGDVPIAAAQITRRWNRWIKKRYGVQKDWYPLKHLNTTEMVTIVGTELTAKHNAHSEEILNKHYDLGKEQRDREKIRTAGNTFVNLNTKAAS